MKNLHAFRQTGGTRRPTVLVADDTPRILETASSLLSEDFDVIAAVPDGRRALDAARRLDPDVAVLDISMPELDGLQTARELKRSGSRAKIVMLTQQELDEYVAVAVESGAHGYVLKARMVSDLARSIEHAMSGRLFVPSLTSLLAIVQGGVGGHAVHFRFNDHDAVDGLSQLLSAAIEQGDAAAVIMTGGIRAAITRRLIASGCDLARAASRGTYFSLDAEAALTQVMAGGQFDASRVAAFVDDLERLRLGGSAPRITIVGEMSPLLCRNANPKAAIQLEHAWDTLTRRLPFLTVCSYPMELFSERGEPALFSPLCAPHWAVSHSH